MSPDAPISQTVMRDAQRICPPQDTLARVQPLMAAFGITRLANITGLDRTGVPVVLAVRPNARSISVSQGKGLTLAHAKVSALMEAVEIWHAEHPDLPVRYASIADLQAAHAFIDLARLPATPRGGMPPHMRLHWVAAEDLISGITKLVPFEMVHADYTHPVSHDAGFFPASTNGLASGNHRLEAICHAICEVVERDALAVWHHLPATQKQATRLEPASVTAPALRGLLQAFAMAGLDCAVWDITSNIGVPSFQCVIHDPATPMDHPGLGSGSHPDPVIALQRALTEAAQTRLNYISGAREDLAQDDYAGAGRSDRQDAFAALLSGPQGTRRFDAKAGLPLTTLEAELDWLVTRLQAAGVREVAVVDLTRADYAIPVVRVIIPGLEAPHDDAAYVAGPRALAAVEGGTR